MKPNLPVNRALKNDAQTVGRALSRNLFAKAWQSSNRSTNLSLQRQSHIHELSNQAQVIFKSLSAYNLSKLCYFIARCTRPFQASFSQHAQMVTAIQELFLQQKHAHSLWKKGRNSFSKYKIQTIHILEEQIILFILKFKLHVETSYMCFFVQNTNYIY